MTDVIIKSAIKVALALLLIGCLYNMPAQYYKLTYVALFSLLIITAVLYLDDKNYAGIVLSLIGAVVFNPIFKIHLEPPVWQWVYKIYATVLIAWAAVEMGLFFLRGKKKGV